MLETTNGAACAAAACATARIYGTPSSGAGPGLGRPDVFDSIPATRTRPLTAFVVGGSVASAPLHSLDASNLADHHLLFADAMFQPMALGSNEDWTSMVIDTNVFLAADESARLKRAIPVTFSSGGSLSRFLETGHLAYYEGSPQVEPETMFLCLAHWPRRGVVPGSMYAEDVEAWSDGAAQRSDDGGRLDSTTGIFLTAALHHLRSKFGAIQTSHHAALPAGAQSGSRAIGHTRLLARLVLERVERLSREVKFEPIQGHDPVWAKDAAALVERDDVKAIIEDVHLPGDHSARRQKFAASLWLLDLREADRVRLFDWLDETVPSEEGGWTKSLQRLHSGGEALPVDYLLTACLADRLVALEGAAQPGVRGGIRSMESWFRHADWRAPDTPDAPAFLEAALAATSNRIGQIVLLTDAATASSQWGCASFAWQLLRHWQDKADRKTLAWIELCRATLAADGGSAPAQQLRSLKVELAKGQFEAVPLGLARALLSHWPIEWIPALAQVLLDAKESVGEMAALATLRATQSCLRRRKTGEARMWLALLQGQELASPSLRAEANRLCTLLPQFPNPAD